MEKAPFRCETTPRAQLRGGWSSPMENIDFCFISWYLTLK